MAIEVFLDVLNSYLLQKLVELRPSKILGQMNRGILGTRGNQYHTGTVWSIFVFGVWRYDNVNNIKK